MKNTTAVLRNPDLVEQLNKQWYQDNVLYFYIMAIIGWHSSNGPTETHLVNWIFAEQVVHNRIRLGLTQTLK